MQTNRVAVEQRRDAIEQRLKALGFDDLFSAEIVPVEQHWKVELRFKSEPKERTEIIDILLDRLDALILDQSNLVEIVRKKAIGATC